MLFAKFSTPHAQKFWRQLYSMIIAKKHPQESERMQALTALQILDTLPQAEFDEITFLAAQICDCPIALISIIDSDRQWFKSRQGLVATETPRDLAFCSHAILQEKEFCIADAKKDSRFHDNPLVTGDPKVEFYLGIPIMDPKMNLPIGTLCVIDHKPREINQDKIQALTALKNQVERLLNMQIQLRELKETKKEIRELSDRQEFILEGAGLGAWDWWLETNHVNFDKRWCEMLGLDPETTRQQLITWDERVHPDDKAQAYEDIKAHLEGRTSVYENIHRIKHTNGDWVWILDRGRVSQRDENGKPIRFTGTHFDISGYKKSEFISLEIQKIANIGGWELDVETFETKWTAQTYEIHGLPIGVPTNKTRGIDFFPPHEKSRIEKCVQECIAGKSYRETFEFIDAKGFHKFVEATGIPVFNSKNEVKTLIGTFQDVSEKVKAERDVELARAKAAHVAKLASLGEMAAGVAHEINNPLAVISASTQLLSKLSIPDAKLNSKLEIITKAVSRISKIVSGLRKFSRTTGASDMQVTVLSDVIKEALIIIETNAKRRATELRIDLMSNSSVLCDAMEIEQVVVNIVNNAIDAARENSQSWVQVTTYDEQDSVVFQVIDSGPGISPEIENKIFQPFFTTKPVGEGTGLGLSICKGILDNHSASIMLNRNQPNTCFEVRFKKAEKAKKAA